MTPLAGVSGSLFPGRFLADWLARDEAVRHLTAECDRARRRIAGWWQCVATSCGPATGLRTLFDTAAMPLAALLGFRASDASFDAARAVVRLTTRRGSTVGLIVLPWAARPSRLWRELATDARSIGADWCLVAALPFISLVDARGHAMRRGLDFVLPDALGDRSFPAFWLLCQAAAFDPGTFEHRAHVAPIDLLVTRGTDFQDAVRQDLRDGVVHAIGALGPAIVRDRHTTADDRFGEALTLVYRVLFLLFAESRDLVPHHQRAYGRAYSLASLCRDAIGADAIQGSAGSIARDGLWDGLAAITRLSRSGCDTADLIVKPFNGRLFARSAAPSLESPAPTRHYSPASRRRDRALATALTALGTRRGPGGRETISYADLGVEQLGAVYEHVLDLNVEEVLRNEIDSRSRSRFAHGHRRKETGTFYTPRPLAAFVVRRTLAPLVRGASADEILRLRVVDPAMGSGAFLVAACRFLSNAYESALVNEGRCAETDLDAQERANIRRLIARRCLAGVDANPVAVQLARLSLWLTSLSKDKPLTFLDDRLRVGNSLVGARPDDLWRVRMAANEGRRREHSTPLFDASGLEVAMRNVAQPLRHLAITNDDSVADVHAKERIWSNLTGDRSPLDPWRTACHLWCARWFWPDSSTTKAPHGGELAAALDAILRGDRTLDRERITEYVERARQSARDHHYFHWPLEFADVFYADDGGIRERPGFDAVIGNPPWEILRKDEDLLSFIRQSGLYPSCSRGHLNLYQPFLERSLDIVRSGGRVGLVLPWGLASDEGASALRNRLLLPSPSMDTIVGLDNSAGIFPIHRGLRFLVLVANPGARPADIRVRFGVKTTGEIDELPGDDRTGGAEMWPTRLSAASIHAIGGTSLRIPDARRPGELEWLLRISSRFPRLGDSSGWNARFGRELNATDDRGSFAERGLPVLDGKHIAPFAVRLDESVRHVEPQEAARLLPDRRFDHPRLAYRDVSAATNRFALIAAIIPSHVVTTHTLFCLRTRVTRQQQDFLCALFNSSTLNAVVRMLIGGHVTTALIESLPVPTWTGNDVQLQIAALGRRLTDAPMDAKAKEVLDALVADLYEPRHQ